MRENKQASERVCVCVSEKVNELKLNVFVCLASVCEY